jgi:hypothetical protein
VDRFSQTKYGNEWDWLLCLGVAILLGARLSVRNPEGHNPRYWRKHPETKITTETPSKSPSEPLARRFWGWQPVGAVVLLFLGGGIGAMTSGHPYISDGFFMAGIVLLLAKLFTWPETEKHRTVAVVLGMVFIIALLSGNHYLNQAWPFSLRSQLEFSCHMNGVYRSTGRDTEVYFKINNPPEAAIQYLNVRIHRTSKSGIRGISEFTYNDCRGDPVNVFPQERNIFRGAKGEHLSIGTEEVTEEYIQQSGSPQWQIQCDRLSGQSFREFSVRVAGDAENDTFNVSGRYELPPSGGSKLVRVNQTCRVTE